MLDVTLNVDCEYDASNNKLMAPPLFVLTTLVNVDVTMLTSLLLTPDRYSASIDPPRDALPALECSVVTDIPLPVAVPLTTRDKKPP
jgi:hypothetical protein